MPSGWQNGLRAAFEAAYHTIGEDRLRTTVAQALQSRTIQILTSTRFLNMRDRALSTPRGLAAIVSKQSQVKQMQIVAQQML